MTLNGSSAWITGAGKGIGEAISKALATEGVRVALTSRTKADLERVAREIGKHGGNGFVVPGDVTKEGDVTRMWSDVRGAVGTPDILINNAGIGVFAPVSDLRIEDLDAMWNVNMRGVFLCTKSALPGMLERGSGIIVNISSLAGKNAFVSGAGYAATKWALNGFSACLRLEVRKQNIKVITVCPGSVATDFSTKPEDPVRLASILHPEDIASAVVAALSLPARAMMSEIDLRPTNPST